MTKKWRRPAPKWRCIFLGHLWEWYSDMAGTSKQCTRCQRYGWPG